MAFIIKRRSIVCAMAALPFAGGARAQAKTGALAYPVAVPGYQCVFVAQAQGFLKEEGYDFKMIQGGSGVKTRAIMAAGEADFMIADILHTLQLNNRQRPTKSIAAVDLRSPSQRWVIRKDLWDQGIDTVEKFAAWKRPNGSKPIFGISSLGGTAHLWAHYYMEKFGFEDSVSWVQVGNVETMLGSLKTRQVDVLSSAISVTTEAEKNGWGKVIYAPSEEKVWNSVIGGPVPVNANFCLAATIDKEPEKVQAFTNAIWRAVQFIKASSPETILATIERFVGSTSRDANLLEIGELKEVADWNGLITPESYARGEKVWLSELTGITQPIKLEDAVADKFLKAAHAKYPA